MKLEPLLDSAREGADNLRRDLGDPALPRGRDPALQFALAESISGRFGQAGWRLAAGVSGRAAVHVFETASDTDPDRIFGPARKGESTVQRPVLHPRTGVAYLKYVLDGDAEADANARSGPARIKLAGDATVAAGAYVPVPRKGTLQQALSGRGADIPWVLDAGDVRAMRPGEACFIALGGELSAALDIEWASVFAGPLGALGELSTSGAPLQLAVDASLGLAFRFSVEDSFRLAFVRTNDGIRAVLHRAGSDAFRMSAEAGMTVRFAQPDAAREVLSQVAASLLGPAQQPLREVVAALDQALGAYDAALARIHATLGGAAAQLDAWFDARGLARALERLDRLQAIAADVGRVAPVFAQRLELTLAQAEAVLDALDRLAADLAQRLGARIDALLEPLRLPPLLEAPREAAAGLLARLDRIEAALLEVAGKRIEAALTLDYQRLDADALVFDADLDPDSNAFAGRHADLLALRLDRLLVDAGRDDGAVSLRLFLHEQKLRRRFSLGLALGSGLRDVARSGHEWTFVERRVRDEGNGALRVRQSTTLKGYRGHEEAFIGSAAHCRGDFDARLRRDDSAPARWRFALSLEFGSRTPRIGRPWLHAAADFGATWGVVAEHEVDALRERLAGIDTRGKPVEVELSLAFGNAAFDNAAFLKAWAEANADILAGALAVALPVVGNLPQRQTPALRRAAYGSALRALAGSEGVDLRNAGAIARHVARNLADATPALRAFEARVPAPFLGTVAQVATHPKAGGRIDGNLRGFLQAGTLLRGATGPATGEAPERERILSALHGLDLGWINRFVLRWQGALLLQLARTSGVPAAAIRPRLALVVDPDGGAPTRHLIAPAR